MNGNDGHRTAVLLDQHPLWLEAVEKLVLARIGIEVMGKATSAEAALSMVNTFEPDVFVTGLRLPRGELDALACVRRVRELVPKVKVVVLSMYEDEQSVERALAAGADAYIVKTAQPDDMASAIRQAFEHSIHYAGPRATVTPPRAKKNGESLHLTRRELEILRLVAEGRTNNELARMLWVTEQTVKFHLVNVYRKLGVANRTEAARYAFEHGLIEIPAPASR
jgi:NarL family two-component system response regulator LiaR